jgi:hypothetical protein
MIWAGLLAAGVLGTGSAWAVSDGDYTNGRNGCTGDAYNSSEPDRAEAGCQTLVFKITDGSHNYVWVGIPETPDGESADSLTACFDPGAGKQYCARFGKGGTAFLPPRPGTPRHPSGGLHTYFGANDNLDGGEHDSSSQVDNGPSDGGGVQANVTPWTLKNWVAALSGGDRATLLTHPLPLGDAGMGFCADGLCFSAQTQRRVAYQGTDPNKSRDVSDYDGMTWDPESCSGPDDAAADCGGQPISYWEEQNGTTYVEPGIQVYEDPDPQGSPIGAYPIPSLYVGTCGFVAGGGGGVNAPASPLTNSAGQLVVKTGC